MRIVYVVVVAFFCASVVADNCFAVSDIQPETITEADIQKDPESIAQARLGAMLIRAKYYAASRDTEKAVELYREVIQEFPKCGYAYLQLASFLLGTDEIDSRIEYLEKAIEVDPKLKDAYSSLGFSYSIKDETEKAIATYKKAIQNVDDNLSFYSNLAGAYLQLSKTKEAEDTLVEACDRHSRSPEAWFKLIEFYVGRREPQKADETLEKALKTTENKLRLLRDVRELYLNRQDDNRATEVLVKTLELYPDSAQMWAQLVGDYLSRGEKDKAKEATDKAISHIRYREDFFTDLAVAYLEKARDLDSAIAVLTQGTEHLPTSVAIWQRLANLYLRKRETDKARECYRKILSLEPMRVQERRLLALSYVAEKKYDQAIKEFQEALRLFPSDIQLFRVDAANIYLMNGQFEEGEKLYLDFIKAQPNDPLGYQYLAVYYYKAGKNDKMEQALQSAVRAETDPALQARIYSRVGQAALEKGDFPTGLKMLREAAARQPEDPSLAYTIGRVYLVTGNREAAVESLEKAVKLAKAPQPDWLITLGQTYRVLDKKEQADESFSNAIAHLQQNCEKDPKNPLAWYQLGLAYETAENDEKAAEAYAESAKLQPQNGDLKYKLATVYSGLRQHQKAREQLENAIKLRSPRPEWFLMLGDVYRTLVKPTESAQAFDKAIQMLQEQKDERPQDFHVWAVLGEAYDRAEQYPQAIEALRKSIELAGEQADFRLHVALARSLESSGQSAEAKEEYLKATALLEETARKQPNDDDTYLRLGLIYQNVRDFAKSSDALAKSIELAGGGSSPTAYLALAESLDKGPKPELARPQYEKAYSVLSERVKEHPADVQARYLLANASEKVGKLDECEREYKTVMELDPFFASAFNNLGYTWIENDMNLDEAMKLVRKALDLEPDNGAYIDSLAWGYFKQGKLDEALSELQRALKFEHSDPTLYDHIGDVYNAKKMIKEAIEYWQKALDMNPNDRKIKDKIEKNKTSALPGGSG